MSSNGPSWEHSPQCRSEEVGDRGGELLRGRLLAGGGQVVFGTLDFNESGAHTSGVETLGEFSGLVGGTIVSSVPCRIRNGGASGAT
jgi:hypothetical protein